MHQLQGRQSPPPGHRLVCKAGTSRVSGAFGNHSEISKKFQPGMSCDLAICWLVSVVASSQVERCQLNQLVSISTVDVIIFMKLKRFLIA